MDKFDWQFYINFYNDLKQKGIKTESQARGHYKLHGKKEGRFTYLSQLSMFGTKCDREIIQKPEFTSFLENGFYKGEKVELFNGTLDELIEQIKFSRIFILDEKIYYLI